VGSPWPVEVSSVELRKEARVGEVKGIHDVLLVAAESL
jgi:hypothetical protein